ncbi:MAG TPA: hypothetical protein VG165_03935 [Solirubrobacteraceae bacterium]|nr:hypothetical protein [Solirubrobacteraceae bacterium]
MGGCRRWIPAVLGACAVVWGTFTPAGASAAGPATRITATLPGLATAGTAVVVSGRISHAPAGSTAELEARPPAGSAEWSVLAKARISGGRFIVGWTPQSAGFLKIRAIVVRRSRTIAATRSTSLLVGAAPVYCAPAAMLTPLPFGTGLIVGGVYNVGGPAPGIIVCQDQANTVTVTDSIGSPVASVELAAGQSYAIVVPAGSYTLTAGSCRGSAVVTQGATTHADTVCAVP